MCSTPFGITVVGTTRFLLVAATILVLNAFRHHCGRHSVTVLLIARTWVLNAFRHHCGRHLRASQWARDTHISGAQRLSASLWSAQRGRWQRAGQRGVLNAFRHHCGRHGDRKARSKDPVRVLNAFGHHCGRHNRRNQRRQAFIRVLNAFRHHCGRHASTLFNVSARPTQGAQRLSASLWSARQHDQTAHDGHDSVLNAFRHHCGRHRVAGWGGPKLLAECSTPFGITVVGTTAQRRSCGDGPVLNAFRHHCGRHRLGLCCRVAWGMVLNAFRHHCGRHIWWRWRPDRRSSVLNAFRHHCGRHPFGIARDYKAGKGAQRLSASLWSALSRSQIILEKLSVLNAFRHHCGRHL